MINTLWRNLSVCYCKCIAYIFGLPLKENNHSTGISSGKVLVIFKEAAHEKTAKVLYY